VASRFDERLSGAWPVGLRGLADQQLNLFSGVLAYRFSDVTESNCRHRGRLKFPSEIEQVPERVSYDQAAGANPFAPKATSAVMR
jgi:hypothetical protein